MQQDSEMTVHVEMEDDRVSILGGVRAIDGCSGQPLAEGSSQRATTGTLRRALLTDAREGIQMSKLKIMLADDHEGFRRILSSFLRSQQGVEVVGEASDGNDAVEQAARLRPDLIFMDLHMPKSDGIQATRAIKGRSPSTRVFILSMDASEYHRNAVEVADGFITKQTMKNAVLTVLAHERLRIDAAAMGA
jgi:CheY-like chemotaxis protein